MGSPLMSTMSANYRAATNRHSDTGLRHHYTRVESIAEQRETEGRIQGIVSGESMKMSNTEGRMCY